MVYQKNYSGIRKVSKKKGFFTNWNVTNFIIFLNIVFFVIFLIVDSILRFRGYNPEFLISIVAIKPLLFLQGYSWTLITSMFMHGSLGHLFVNMVSLFFVGSFIERLIGRKRYIWFYLISGIVSGLFFVTFAYIGQFIPNGASYFGGVDDFAVGASGALFGLAGLLVLLLPRLKVLVFFILPMQMWLAMVILLFGLWIVSIFAGLPIGNTAHFGGLVVGLVYGYYLKKKYPKKVRALSRYFY